MLDEITRRSFLSFLEGQIHINTRLSQVCHSFVETVRWVDSILVDTKLALVAIRRSRTQLAAVVS
ncbi:hypothetical protein M6B38_252850 [Iris pallida]|uniref:Uncharacterized protein n=1 Tax=Iris pallida TaxID=29817 RepID=A0AAX6II43_IRIPA|nr:hypothetical protein M6B38_362525 [Iris pallida]KAJ6852892.1 hypothetical protein M6B38_252850 [Iris pallida]